MQSTTLDRDVGHAGISSRRNNTTFLKPVQKRRGYKSLLSPASPVCLFGGGGQKERGSSGMEATTVDRVSNRGALRLYLDSASVLQWDKWSRTGLLYGFTTNPTILVRDQVPQCNVKVLSLLAQQGFNLGAKEIQLQAWGSSAGKLYSTGLDLAAIEPRIVVKIPITMEGVEAANLLKAQGVRVTLTALYSAHQAMTAIAAGADYAAPYVGRIKDLGGDGLGEVVAMQQVIENLDSSLRLLVASIRSTTEIVTLANQGCNTFTISPGIAEQLFKEQPTIAAAAAFDLDASSLGGSL